MLAPKPSTGPTTGELSATLYIGVIALAAEASGLATMLFPELGALAHDVLTRPHGAWAKAPWMLMATPVITGALGTLIARTLPYGPLSIFLSIGLAVLVIRLLRSPIAPAISAGLLPVTVGATSWWYPPSILFGTAFLASLSLLHTRLGGDSPSRIAPVLPDHAVPARNPSWMPYCLAFLTLDATLAWATGWRFLLFPPLVVLAVEMFSRAPSCPWATRPAMVPVACAITATIGTVAVTTMGSGPIATMISMAAGIAVLRLLRLHMPPALAVGLLPFILDHPDIRFPIAVTGGTLILVATFWAWRRTSPAATTIE